MPSSAEVTVSRAVRAVLRPLAIGTTVDWPDAHIANGLEYFIPEILLGCFAYWKQESLDGIFVRQFRKLARYAVEISGTCILISDQSVTPFHVRLEIAPAVDEVVWMECRLGAVGTGAGGMARTPYVKWKISPLKASVERVDAIDWVYRATFGVRNCHGNWD